MSRWCFFVMMVFVVMSYDDKNYFLQIGILFATQKKGVSRMMYV